MIELFHLIKTLKPAEKRYFTLSASVAGSKKTNYLKLFEAIEKMELYNEEDLIKKNRKESFIKNLAVHKNYLYELILEILRNYNEENVEEWKIRKNFYKIRLLASKGLDNACLKLIEKTKQRAWQYEVYSVLEDILELQLYLFGNLRIGNMEEAFFEQIQMEREKLLRIITDYNFVLSSWHRINILLLNQTKEPFDTVKEKAFLIIKKLEAFGDKGTDYSLILRNRFLACFELYYNGIGDAENCYLYNKKIIENRIVIDERMPNFSVDAMAVYFNFMVACFKQEKWDEMEEYLLKTKDYPVNSIEQEIRRTHNYCYNGMLLYLSTNRLDKAAEVTAVFDDARKKYAGKYRIDFLLFTQSLCGFYFFRLNQLETASKWWREIIDGPKYSVEIRTQATTRIYLMLMYIKLKEWDLLEYETVNVSRYIKSVNLMGERERIFLNECKSLAKLSHTKKDFSGIAAALLNVKEPLTEKSVVNNFVISWVSDFCA
jgi:hypothetical protein